MSRGPSIFPATHRVDCGTKHQIPNKQQSPKSKTQDRRAVSVCRLRHWFLSLVWILEFVIWDLRKSMSFSKYGTGHLIGRLAIKTPAIIKHPSSSADTSHSTMCIEDAWNLGSD
jgi:hypothetical protein